MPPDGERSYPVREWFQLAREDLRAARRLLASPPLPHTAAFHCQQAMEKVLKGFLDWHGLPIYKTHDLTDLVVRCTQIDVSLDVLRERAIALAPYAIVGRYPDAGIEVDYSKVVDALRCAEEAMALVRHSLPDEAWR